MRRGIHVVAVVVFVLVALVSVRVSALAEGRYIEVRGTVERTPESPDGGWTIGGKVVRIPDGVRVASAIAPIAVGAVVEVKGWLRDDLIDATSVEVRSPSTGIGDRFVEIRAALQSVALGGNVGEWRIDGRSVRVTAGTALDFERGPATVGVAAEVRGTIEPDGRITATRVTILPATDPEQVIVRGRIEALPPTGFSGDWRIGGRTVNVSSITGVNQQTARAAVGIPVEARGLLLDDGTSLLANHITVLGNTTGVTAVRTYGVVAATEGDAWRIDGRTVRITPETRLPDVPVAPGSYVRIDGRFGPDGTVTATDLVARAGISSAEGTEVRFEGTVDHLSEARWIVDGRDVMVTDTTRIRQKFRAPGIGAVVLVRGRVTAAGSIAATRIVVRR